MKPLELELALKELAQRKTVQSSAQFVPHKPTSKQAAFLKVSCLEALYGGAAGGGKSDALLMAALQYVHIPGYAALLLRRTYADLSLPGAIMDRSHTWLQGTGAIWNGQEKRWTFPSGATLTFGYLDNDKDRYRYQGAELQFIGFDELTQFPESWYIYLLSRLRRVHGITAPLRARSASNPGGIGHDWVRRRFVEGGGNCAFVSATLDDNPHLDREEYRQSLALLDPTTRRQLLEGLWVRDVGGLVYKFDEGRNLVDTLPPLTNYILGIDYGFNDSTAFCILGWRDHDPSVYAVRCWKQSGLTPSAAAEIVHRLEQQYQFASIVGDTGGLGKGYAEEARARFNLPIQAAEKNNKRGYIDLINGDFCDGRIRLLGRTGAGEGSFLERIGEGDEGPNEALQKELIELPWNEERTKESPGFDNHCCDAMLYGWRACRAFLAEPIEVRPKAGSEEYWQEEARQIEQRLEEQIMKKRDWWET